MNRAEEVQRLKEYTLKCDNEDKRCSLAHSEDCIFIVRSLLHHGYSISPVVAAALWGEVSGKMSARWLQVGCYSGNDIFDMVSKYCSGFGSEYIMIPSPLDKIKELYRALALRPGGKLNSLEQDFVTYARKCFYGKSPNSCREPTTPSVYLQKKLYNKYRKCIINSNPYKGDQ